VPDPIAYGVALSDAQLNATALIPGKFAYLPGDGAVLAAGRHSLTLAFVPADSTNYTVAHATVSLSVTKAVPAIKWATPASIAYGAALSDAQLNATASVPGTFVYTPAAGEVLAAEVQSLSVVFTPANATNYTTAEATVQITVTKATPIITWSKPQAISYGTALSASQLNATASVPGTFAYIPAVGEVLAAGRCLAHDHQSHAHRHVACARSHSQWRCPRRRAAQCHGIGSGNLRLHACRGRLAPGGNAYAFGHLHAKSRRELHRGAGDSVAHGHRSCSGHPAAGSRSS
jgi:hypothetical protein